MRYIPILLIFLYSCSTSRKSKSVTKEVTKEVTELKIDSSALKTVDSVSVKKDNTVTTIEKSDDYEKETVIEYEPVPTGTKAEDYFPAKKKETIKEKGVKKEKQTVAANTYDSTQLAKHESADLKKEDKTNLVKTEIVKNKDVKRTGGWGWLWWVIIVIIYAGGIYINLWKWDFGLIAWMRKRKDTQNYPVKYTKYQPPKPPSK